MAICSGQRDLSNFHYNVLTIDEGKPPPKDMRTPKGHANIPTILHEYSKAKVTRL